MKGRRTLGQTFVAWVLLLGLGACTLPQNPAGPDPTPSPTTPTTPPTTPTTPPLTSLNLQGKLANWRHGEAYLTFAGSYSVEAQPGNPNALTLGAPRFNSRSDAAGNFAVTLTPPSDAAFKPLGCTAHDPQIAGVVLAVASRTAEPQTLTEIIGFYSYGDPAKSGKRGIWLYSKAAYTVNQDCDQTANTQIKHLNLKLEPGWNEAIWQETPEGVSITSGSIPKTFVWSQYL